MGKSRRALYCLELILIIICAFKKFSVNPCKCFPTSTPNGIAVQCSFASKSLEMPQCTAVFEKTREIKCSDENVIVIDGEYTGAQRMINISCISSYPTDIDFDGMFPHRSIAISFYRSKMNGYTNSIISTLIVNMNTEPEITGKYSVYRIDNKMIDTSFYIFAETNLAPFLLNDGKQLIAREDDDNIVFPCRSFNQNQTIRVKNMVTNKVLKVENYGRFDPTVGFIFRKPDLLNIEGLFECFVDNSEDSVEVTYPPASSPETRSDDQALFMNVTGKWANCVSKRKNMLNFRLINMRARNPSEARMKKKCLEGDNECVGKREGSLNLCSYAQYCKTVDFKDGGGIVSCFRRNAKSSHGPMQYLLGLDQKTYLNPETLSAEEILPSKALLQISTHHRNKFYSDIVYKFTCTAISYLFAQPLKWSIKFKNGSISTITGLHNQETTKQVASFNNYKSEQELTLSKDITHMICSAYIWNSENSLQIVIPISVEESAKPTFAEVKTEVKLIFNHTIQKLECDVDAKPTPHIEWRKSNKLIKSETITAENTSLYFYYVKYGDAGIYTCFASNPLGNATKSFKVTIEEENATGTNYFITVGIPLGILIITVTVTILLLKYYRKMTTGLSKEEIEEFMEGREPLVETGSNCYVSNIQCIPYEKDYEIMEEDFEIDTDSVLGSGAFGIVYRGIASGRNVAIKTLKKYSDLSYLRSLLSELKVMLYLKEHPNIVNLIGANTKDLHKGIVFVMVELCPVGSLESYLKKNRPYFQDTFAGLHEYLNEPNKKAMGGYLDVVDFTTSDLVNWSHQIANGMEYLASKNVIHGDLAVRNILLYDKSCAKISDFGLSRKIYEYSNYVKKSQEPLPWRYLALETLKDLSFSTQSDVWAFGVTLWEIFSLAELPFVGLSWDPDFTDKIETGLRMCKPKYANQQLYQVMLQCWENNAEKRPSFSDLKLIFENLLKIL